MHSSPALRQFVTVIVAQNDNGIAVSQQRTELVIDISSACPSLNGSSNSTRKNRPATGGPAKRILEQSHESYTREQCPADGWCKRHHGMIVVHQPDVDQKNDIWTATRHKCDQARQVRPRPIRHYRVYDEW